jgi:hypothetical protein
MITLLHRFSMLLLLGVASPGFAATLVPLVDIEGGSSTVPLADAVAGWQFTTSQPFHIAGLGLWDEGGDGLEVSHEVGLWTASGTLLVSALVSNASTPIASHSSEGRWLFTGITPFTLMPGTYVTGAVWGNPVTGADSFRFPSTVTTPANVAVDGSTAATLLPAPVLVFPGGTSGPPGSGTFGPNLAVAIPEPGGAGLLLIGGLMLWSITASGVSSARPGPRR